MENQPNPTPNPNKKKILIIAGTAVVFLAVGGFVYFSKNQQPSSVPGKNVKDSLLTVKKDSVAVKDTLKSVDYGEEGSPYTEYRVIASSVNLPSGKLSFGDKVFADDSKSTEGRKLILLQDPYKYPNTSGYDADAALFIEDYRFDEYKNNFSLPPFSSLPTGVKKILMNENYSDGNKYAITQNKERAKSSVVLGDFDGDGIRDAAVLMDNNEKQISRLLIICSNEVTKQPYIAFAENYSDKMKVSLDPADYAPVSRSGLIVTGEDIELSVLYDPDSQKFKTTTQGE
ncbi:MAG: hypothetical protein LBE92_07180 [Chryseobacterium sp.]|jgi:hypothetical protein|uniref:hypothetical protein n=1 Tax=Chryseobacterium sp. TaxID=1871047 RepID=UPI002824B0EB|nr:hypothetical protein [Chryseobacterium sp.]MDR2235890.1 hypothetical protein [Chryseobacterium sp.]